MAYGDRRLRGLAFFGFRDFTLSLVLFWGVVIGVCTMHRPAHAVDIPRHAVTTTQSSEVAGAQPARTYAAAAQRPVSAVSARPTLLMLGFVFATLTMLNLAFVRHLRRTYARPKALRAVRNQTR